MAKISKHIRFEPETLTDRIPEIEKYLQTLYDASAPSGTKPRKTDRTDAIEYAIRFTLESIKKESQKKKYT